MPETSSQFKMNIFEALRGDLVRCELILCPGRASGEKQVAGCETSSAFGANSEFSTSFQAPVEHFGHAS
jgi:hypothetical protein